MQTPAESSNVDAANMSLTALADHIEEAHHAYLKEELPVLVEQADRVAYKHGWRDQRLGAIAVTMRRLATEMFDHMEKEERVLFPLVRDLERGNAPASNRGAIGDAIQAMELEHEAAGDALVQLRGLTDGFTPDAEACNTHRAMLAGFARLEADMHQHVHKENNVLFPRALTLERSAA